MEKNGILSTEKWQSDQLRIQQYYERAEAQLQRTKELQERYRQQVSKIRELKFFRAP